jgi:hypothetical protein
LFFTKGEKKEGGREKEREGGREHRKEVCLEYIHALLAVPSSAPPWHTGPVSSAPGLCDTMHVIILINVAGQI